MSGSKHPVTGKYFGITLWATTNVITEIEGKLKESDIHYA
jgi:hypothetical protein